MNKGFDAMRYANMQSFAAWILSLGDEDLEDCHRDGLGLPIEYLNSLKA